MEMPRCFILLGGQGTRLEPLTKFVHKSMIPLDGKPVIEYIIDNLKKNDVKDIVFCVNNSPMKKQFFHYFKDGSRLGVKIRYSLGSLKLNTAGRILEAKNLVDDTFIVYYGDVLANLSLKQVCDFHQQKRGIGTIVFSSTLPTSVGVGILDDECCVKEVKEKPLLPFPTNMGIYVLEPKILDYIKPNYDFFRDVFPLVIQKKENLYGYLTNSHWIDIGESPTRLQKAELFVKQNFGS